MLVHRRVGRMMVLDVAVVGGSSKACEPTETVAGRDGALRARQSVLEAVPVFAIQDPVSNSCEIGPERVGHGLWDVHPPHLGLREGRRARERQRATTKPARVSANEIDAHGASIDRVGEELRGGDALALERGEDARDDRVTRRELEPDYDPAVARAA